MLTRREIVALSLAFVVTLPIVTKRLYASDEVQYFSWLRSVAFDRDADFDNEYRHFYDTGVVRTDGFRETFLNDERLTEAGRRINFAPVGAAILWAPFYGLGHLAALATGAPADGYSRPYVAAVAYASAVYGFLAVLLSAAFARRILGHGLRASLIVAIGTPLLFYVYVAPPFAHAASAFAVSLFLVTWLYVRQQWTWQGALALGAIGALMAMVREQDLLFVAGPAIDFLRSARQPATARPSMSTVAIAAIAGTIAFVLAYTPQLFAYQSLNGHPGPTVYATRKMYWYSPHALGVVLSPEHGLFFWTPLAVIALAGLAIVAVGRIARDRPDAAWLATLALMMFGLQVYISGSVDSWTVAGAFGQRRFVATTPLLTLGMAAWFAIRAPLGRVALAIGVALCVWWNLGLMALFGTNRMDRQRLTLAANARATFVSLPLEAPSLVWRYLTDRSSFYQSGRR
ncbi:MAG TPA: hypothetical protein VFO19_04570 [Vicinamibacterales bacterium]|nr:hypothetical protein [Vicinamibacterales bacterium]